MTSPLAIRPGGEWRSVSKAGGDTRTRLLAAAEHLLVARGITGVSVRKVGEEAGVNATLVTYHFGSITGLLEELCRCNMEPILADWARIAAEGNDLPTILRGWLQPMLRPSAFTDGGRALVVLDEIGAHGEGEIRAHVLREMEGFARRLPPLLAPHLPPMDADEMRARLRFISGAVLGPPPRSHGAPRFASGKGADDIEYLLRFATAALTG
jgi:AcrR family transcriptional regulator